MGFNLAFKGLKTWPIEQKSCGYPWVLFKYFFVHLTFSEIQG